MAGNCKRGFAGFTGLQGKQTAEGMITFDDNPMTGIVGRKYDPGWGSMRAERSLLSILGADKAKMYTRLALMGVAQQAGDHTVDDLIQMVGIGLRDLTPDEFQRVVTHVANAGFDPDRLERAGSRIAGLLWNGKVVKGGDLLPPGEVHYLRHVVAGREWPEGTSINDYYASLRSTIVDSTTKIVISRYGNFWQIGFWGVDGTWVEYRVQYRYWSTGLRPTSLEKVINSKYRKFVKWLR